MEIKNILISSPFLFSSLKNVNCSKFWKVDDNLKLLLFDFWRQNYKYNLSLELFVMAIDLGNNWNLNLL